MFRLFDAFIYLKGGYCVNKGYQIFDHQQLLADFNFKFFDDISAAFETVDHTFTSVSSYHRGRDKVKIAPKI